jgi:hypothetical protein
MLHNIIFVYNHKEQRVGLSLFSQEQQVKMVLYAVTVVVIPRVYTSKIRLNHLFHFRRTHAITKEGKENEEVSEREKRESDCMSGPSLKSLAEDRYQSAT